MEALRSAEWSKLTMPDLSRARTRMVDIQIARRGVRDRHVLDAMPT